MLIEKQRTAYFPPNREGIVTSGTEVLTLCPVPDSRRKHLQEAPGNLPATVSTRGVA